MVKLEDRTDQPPYGSRRTYWGSSHCAAHTSLSHGPQTISATARQVDNSCSPSCRCRCHIGKKYGQFRIAPFHSLFGSISIIFFGWRLMGPRCNILSCHKIRMKLMEVTYSTPLKPLGISIVASARFYDGTPSIGISLGPTVNIINEQDYRSIFPCVRGLKLLELKKMLQRRPGAIIDVSHRQGFSSLHYAFELGSVEAIKVLLAAGSDPFHEDHWGMPAMFDAFVRMLGPAKCSASIQTKDKAELEKALPFSVFFDDYNFTHLHRVVVGARPLRIEAALSMGLHAGDINAQDDMGMTPLHWAALKDDVEAVSALLAAGADFTIRNKRGKTALWKACLNNAYASAVQLLAFGADVNAGSNYGYMPIHGAAKSNASDELLSLLLEHGAELDDARNSFDRTPLNRAISCDIAQSCAFLLDRGANINRLNREGDTPIFEGVKKNAHACLELLISRGAEYHHVRVKQTVLHVAAMRGDRRTFEILMAAEIEGVDVNARDGEGMTARGLFARRVGVPAETIAAFNHLLVSLNPKGIEESDEEKFSDAVEYLE
ncbi:ankyrin repeat domain-containing protein 44 [Nannizzia gypsea CBS 118893]|uniref:Ankyrin repeat domain-containing protein 44 n=1 Tax=Arthroderma gypseum (strain ATCC MYA-4604 / CBS 118893) TaxID=535722 RepID=E4UPN0_ARTGP|nr:ankyrin repeat domain-containing protein 44 [Nannizzia gypsea CBS 118893]EFQ99067.1 ankyrin repeat domain-containing protein 44 [Nannizzia gypsea CBS 118893]